MDRGQDRHKPSDADVRPLTGQTLEEIGRWDAAEGLATRRGWNEGARALCWLDPQELPGTGVEGGWQGLSGSLAPGS